MNKLIGIIMWLVLLVVGIIWAIVGLLLWIPLLVRVTTVFSAMVIHATVTGQKPDALRSHLESACRFYPEGFRIAFEVVHMPISANPKSIEIRLWPVFGECLWTATFWIFLLMIFHVTLLVPVWAAMTVIFAAIRDWFLTGTHHWLLLLGVLAIFTFGAIFGFKLRSVTSK